MSVEICRMACVDGFSINAITNSTFIRNSFIEKGWHLPKAHRGVMKLVYDEYENCKKLMILGLERRVKAGSRFAISLDEYTSQSNKRYLTVNLHELGTYWNLGMVPINESMPASVAVKLMTHLLQDFNIVTEKHIQ